MDDLKIRGELFLGGCFIGLLLYAPFVALLDFFLPNTLNANVVYYNGSLMMKWIFFCGVLTAIFYHGKELL